MPYLLFAAGIVLAIYAFLRFFMGATPAQIKQFFLTCFLAIYVLILIELSVTGRLAIAIILVLALIPFIIAYYRKKAKKPKALPAPEKFSQK